MKPQLLLFAALIASSACALAEHAGSPHPADAVQGQPIANPAPRTGLPLGVDGYTDHAHAGYNHPVIATREAPPPNASASHLALPVGVDGYSQHTHAGYQHPVVATRNAPAPNASASRLALPLGVSQ